MTILESKADRDSRGIDSPERGLIYATLLLYKANKDPNHSLSETENPFFDSVSFNLPNVDSRIATFSFEAKLPFDRVASLNQGGDYLSTIGDMGGPDPNPITINCPASDPSFVAIEDDPAFVSNLEQYLAWLAHYIKDRKLRSEIEKPGKIETQFFNESQVQVGSTRETIPQLRIRGEIPIDYPTYLTGNNLICAVLPMMEPLLRSEFSDSVLIDDSFVLQD